MVGDVSAWSAMVKIRPAGQPTGYWTQITVLQYEPITAPPKRATAKAKASAKLAPTVAPPPSLTVTTQPPPASAATIRQAQGRLRAAGFDPGPADGTMGPRTREALQRFQAREGLPITGTLDAATRTALGVN